LFYFVEHLILYCFTFGFIEVKDDIKNESLQDKCF